MKNIFIILLIVLFSLQAYAQDDEADSILDTGTWSPNFPECEGDMSIEVIDEGARAPFSGQLFANDAAACLGLRLDLCIQLANEEIRYRNDLCTVEKDYLQRINEVENESNEQQIVILEDALEDALTTHWYESTVFIAGVGIVIGITMGYGIAQIAD